VSDPFRDRVAVITGGAGGIGLALARAFAARGAKLVLADVAEERLARAVKELDGEGATVCGVPTDVTRLASVEALAAEAFRRYGGAHVVCNNAGVAILGPMVQATDADWELTMGINFWGVVNGVRAFVPRLLEQGQGGHVVNTASMAGLVGMQWLGIYCASKFAVVGLSESLERELREADIGVSVLCPMIVATPIAEHTREVLARDRRPSAAVVPPQDQMRGGVIAADEVARRVVRAVDERRFYVLTHPEQREILRRRAERLDGVFEPERWEPPASGA
jgi:NAD(P)-dependent dehydrogenase (short-subunit alcohol dehydrogenase family)